ncbi:MAG: HD domain-containing protein [Myxococcota bacterium]
MRSHLPPCSRLGVATGFGLFQLRQWLRQAAQRAGVGRARPLEPEVWSPPDSALVKRARELAREAYDDHLHGHGERTWAFAMAVATHLGLRPDPEALHVACLLHDLGLTEQFAGEGPFELRGADAAHAMCLPDHVRADIVHEAIALHTSLSAAFGPAEVRLVQTGSGGDLVGLDREFVHPRTRELVERQWPTTPEFAHHVVGALRRETAKHPRSPGARLLQVGFAGRVKGYQRGRQHRLAR